MFEASTCQILPRATEQNHKWPQASCLGSQAADGNLTAMARSNTQLSTYNTTLKLENTSPMQVHEASSLLLPLKTQDEDENNSKIKPSQ